MDATWIAPPAVLLIGSAALAGVARRLVRSSDQLARSGRRLQDIEHALIPVRVETRRLRASNDRIHRR